MSLTAIIFNLSILLQGGGPCSGPGPGPPCCNNTPPCGPPPPPGLPIDNFIFVLVILGMFYGAWKYWQFTNNAY